MPENTQKTGQAQRQIVSSRQRDGDGVNTPVQLLTSLIDEVSSQWARLWCHSRGGGAAKSFKPGTDVYPIFFTMGIPGLLRVLQDVHNIIRIEEYSGKIVAVDAMCWCVCALR